MAHSTKPEPIIPGFSPDPSIVLVDGTYFLVNSTFHLFPGLPVYTSDDLVHWHHIGNAINRSGQLSLAKSSTIINYFDNGDHMYATGGLYAPTIRYRDGTFYITCTNVVHSITRDVEDELQNFVVSTTNIYANDWSAPIPFEFYGIDPSIFFDVDGKAYICGSKSPGPDTKIMLFEIDLKTGTKLTEEKALWHGTGGIYPEGPHIYSKNGFYYLLIAEGGTHEGHSVTMARSRDLWGPYKPSPKNPVLSAAGTNNYVQCTGHCDIFQDKHGEWWGVYLGIRMAAPLLYGLGRETFLIKGTWNEDDWLTFDPATTKLTDSSVLRNGKERLTSSPHVKFLYIHDPDMTCYKISAKELHLRANSHDLTASSASPTFVGERQRGFTGKASVVLNSIEHDDTIDTSESIVAGLAIYKDEHRFLRIQYVARSHSVQFQLVNRAKQIYREQKLHLRQPSKPMTFIIEFTETSYQAYLSANDEQDMRLLGTATTMELSGKDFTGPIVGVYAAHAPGHGGTACFSDFLIQGGNI